jgi:uroporphyrinogen decarboxylase
MTSYERVLTTLRHHEPDRVPYNLRPSAEMQALLQAQTGQTDFDAWFGCDVRYVPLGLPPCPAEVVPQEWTPRPTDPQIEQVRQEVARHQAAGFAVCSAYECGVFEQAKHWIGDEATMVGPYVDPEPFAQLLDRITDWKMRIYGAYVEAGVDVVWIGDDLGTQRSLVMSPRQYREWYRPRHQRIVDHLRGLRSDVYVAFHCCGHVTPLIPDLIDIGIDILEAVQAETMDIAGLKREFGRDLTFWGAVGAQSVLARTTPEEVREGVRRTLSAMAPGGGYIAAPCHTLTEEVPWASVVAFREAMQRYGAYPDGWASP